MNSKVVAAGVFAAACITAAASGAYLAVRQNDQPPAHAASAGTRETAPAARAVAETEAVVAPPTPASGLSAPAPLAEAPVATPGPRRDGASVAEPGDSNPPIAARQDSRRRLPAASRPAVSSPAARNRNIPTAAPSQVPPVAPQLEKESVPVVTASADPVPEAARPQEPPAPPERQFDEVVVPASAVMGLQVETPVSSERSQVEDRVDARVTRDVSAAGRVAIPAGSRVIGSITLVEKGGKVKERARLGVRFHTLVLADGREMPLRTEAIFREGESPAADSARKIGGSAIGGAILGAIMGGSKGAAIGGAAGAAGGSAAVMAGDRHAATLAAGTIVTVRLAAPVALEVEKR